MRSPGGRLVSFVRGFSSPLPAASLLLSRRGLKRYAVWPVLVSAVLYAAAIALFVYSVSGLEWHVQWEFWGPIGGWISTAWNGAFDTFKWAFTLPIALAVTYFSFSTVGMVVSTPFSEMLSERVERVVSGDPEAVDRPLTLTVRTMVFGTLDAIGTVTKQIIYSLLALPFLLVPVIGFLPLFLVVGYFSGYGFLDVAMGRSFLGRRHKKAAARAWRWEILGLGVAMELLFWIPFVGLVVLPLGVVAGTKIYCRIPWERLFAERGLQRPKGFSAPQVPG